MITNKKITKNPEFNIENLKMKFADLVPEGRTLRVFNSRGDVTPYEKTITGIRAFHFPPMGLDNHRFFLNFRENETGLLVQDIEQDMLDLMVRTDGYGHHPLGQNREDFEPFEKPGYEFIDTKGNFQLLIFQDGEWLPNEFTRIGSFHKFLGGKWISFRVESKLSISHKEDCFYLQIKITNRTDKKAEFTVVPYQYMNDDYHLGRKLPVRYHGFNNMRYYSKEQRKEYSFGFGSDIKEANDEGYILSLEAKESKTFVIKYSVDEINSENPFLAKETYNEDTAKELEETKNVTLKTLGEMYSAMPRVKSSVPLLERFYDTCIFNVWGSKWHRENFILDPLYSVGSWLFTIAWDTSFASELLAMTDPSGIRKTILKYIELDVRKASYIVAWEAPKMNRVYLQSLFAVTKLLSRYIQVTGDKSILFEELHKDDVNGTVLSVIKEDFLWLFNKYMSEDGLLDFGKYTDQLIEIRSDGYKHKVCTVNALAAFYITYLSKWLEEAGDKDSTKLYNMGKNLQTKVEELMWDEDGKFFASIYPDGSKQLVYSYHEFDFIESPFLSKEKSEDMISHLEEGVFLGKYGMYSIAKTDECHYDFEDADFGGGGQYPGMTFQIVESLYRLGHEAKGFDILKRCMRWSEGYPYYPQEVYADKLSNPPAEQYIEICAGGGATDIIFGTFGFRISESGKLIAKPAYQKEMVGSTITDYKYRGHVYDLALREEGFSVSIDNNEVQDYSYGETAELN